MSGARCSVPRAAIALALGFAAAGCTTYTSTAAGSWFEAHGERRTIVAVRPEAPAGPGRASIAALHIGVEPALMLACDGPVAVTATVEVRRETGRVRRHGRATLVVGNALNENLLVYGAGWAVLAPIWVPILYQVRAHQAAARALERGPGVVTTLGSNDVVTEVWEERAAEVEPEPGAPERHDETLAVCTAPLAGEAVEVHAGSRTIAVRTTADGLAVIPLRELLVGIAGARERERAGEGEGARAREDEAAGGDEGAGAGEGTGEAEDQGASEGEGAGESEETGEAESAGAVEGEAEGAGEGAGEAEDEGAGEGEGEGVGEAEAEDQGAGEGTGEAEGTGDGDGAEMSAGEGASPDQGQGAGDGAGDGRFLVVLAPGTPRESQVELSLVEAIDPESLALAVEALLAPPAWLVNDPAASAPRPAEAERHLARAEQAMARGDRAAAAANLARARDLLPPGSEAAALAGALLTALLADRIVEVVPLGPEGRPDLARIERSTFGERALPPPPTVEGTGVFYGPFRDPAGQTLFYRFAAP